MLITNDRKEEKLAYPKSVLLNLNLLIIIIIKYKARDIDYGLTSIVSETLGTTPTIAKKKKKNQLKWFKFRCAAITMFWKTFFFIPMVSKFNLFMCVFFNLRSLFFESLNSFLVPYLKGNSKILR